MSHRSAELSLYTLWPFNDVLVYLETVLYKQYSTTIYLRVHSRVRCIIRKGLLGCTESPPIVPWEGRVSGKKKKEITLNTIPMIMCIISDDLCSRPRLLAPISVLFFPPFRYNIKVLFSAVGVKERTETLASLVAYRYLNARRKAIQRVWTIISSWLRGISTSFTDLLSYADWVQPLY